MGCLVACGLSAYWSAWTTFRFWDDEGYVLISLRNFAAGGSLYDEVFSQYGPFYNLFFAGLHRLCRFPLDPAGARAFVCVVWTATSLGVFWLLVRTTRSLTCGLGAALGTFVLLRTLTHEPLHPVGLVALLAVAGAVIAFLDLAAGRDQRALVVATIAGTLLALVKINVGAFYLAGVGVFLLWSSTSALDRPWTRALVIAAAVTAGAMLMRPLLDKIWVQRFALVYAFASATTLGVLAFGLRPHQRLRIGLMPVLVTAFSVGAFVLGLAVAVGVRPTQLLEGMILGPSRHPTAFSFPFRWSGLTLPVLAANGVAFTAWCILRSSRPRLADCIVAGARIVVSAGFLLSFFHQFTVSLEGYLLSFAFGFAWSLAAPLGIQTPGGQRARYLLAALALFQPLHAFPVAGTQLAVGTVLLVLLFFISFADLISWLQTSVPTSAGAYGARLIATGGILLPLWGFARATNEAGQRYFAQSPEAVTGARLHLSAWQTSTFDVLRTNIRAHSDMLFSLPGLFSLNLWTDHPTPTLANITQWWSLLNPAQQTAIADKLAAASRPLIVVQRNLITSGLAMNAFRPSLLTRVIERDFTLRFSIDSYEVWTRRDTPFQPLHIAIIPPASTPEIFEFYTLRSDLAATRRIEFHHYSHDGSTLLRTVSKFTLSPTSAGETAIPHWQCRITEDGSLPADCDVVRLLTEDGRIIVELRFPRPGAQANPE